MGRYLMLLFLLLISCRNPNNPEDMIRLKQFIDGCGTELVSKYPAVTLGHTNGRNYFTAGEIQIIYEQNRDGEVTDFIEIGLDPESKIHRACGVKSDYSDLFTQDAQDGLRRIIKEFADCKVRAYYGGSSYDPRTWFYLEEIESDWRVVFMPKHYRDTAMIDEQFIEISEGWYYLAN